MENKKMEFKNTEKWKMTLDNCIRCGYCYEHCPLTKFTRWESDAPRARLVMLFGLLSGELEPSTYVADKLFSCFYCKRCEAACSSGVPLTDIFTDAKADFAGTEFEMPGTTSVTGPDCVCCLACVRACPHEARYFEDGVIITDPVKCQGCGICVDVCPRQTIEIQNTYGTDRAYLDNEVTRFLKQDNAKAIVFGCNWSYYPDFQTATGPDPAEPREYKILINMCGGRLQKAQLIEPFLHKAWGVLVACCPDGDCEHDGNVKAKAHVKYLKNALELMDIDPDRIQLVQIAHGDKAGFQSEINTFMEKINTLGPLIK
ncbi:MAG: hydrogenase iron-sulfur subunit [Desulfobacteraceae bacterium]